MCFNYEFPFFIFKKRSICLNDDVFEDGSLPNTIEDAVTSDEGDLTGNPLKVDLGSIDDTVQLLANSVRAVSFWPPDETKHFPLSEREARKIVRRKLKNPNKNNLPTYVICSGNDPLNTVVFGYHLKDLMFSKVYILNCIKKDDASKKLNDMVKSHLKLEGPQEVTYLVKMKYDIYGRSFKTLPNQNASLRKLGKHASLSVDVVCPQCIFNTFPMKDAILKMNLEIIVGHPVLSLHNLWTELSLLQSYISILWNVKQGVDEYMLLSSDPIDMNVICGKMCDLVSPRVMKCEVDKEVDLNNIREENILDHLWNLLKHCEDIYTLRECFYHFFELLLEKNSNSGLIKENKSNIVTIINSILSGKSVLSPISHLQAVELLFELGALKLKNDYQVILKQFSITVQSKIEAVWSEYFLQCQPSEDNIRHTRVTQNFKTFGLELRIDQLSYLTQLHIASEFIYVVKELVTLSEDSFYYLCASLEKEYVHKKQMITDFMEVFQSPLCAFSFELQSKDAALLEEGHIFPSRWTLNVDCKLNSLVQETTVYDLSDFPVFPPVIYDEYDIPINQEMDSPNMYYASKMVERKGF
ncbi:uncharacterized protein LOC132701552 isoform X2 [Cylas formicarius]|uniref:uncharacterized protein LOC132701552 isoform X2 n=1 Tax=Cylas formicarius TaxID=197179 RepID=UPI0029589E55|nr:uncharacterized protein LOC132701552 isoform X2 [Cylas formicarius]